MNLSHLVNVVRVQQDQLSYAPQQPKPYMATSMMNSTYVTQPQQQYAAYIPTPPSPPMEEASKCSLPSISSLLGIADDGSAQQQQQSHGQQQGQQPIQQTVEYRQSASSRGLPPTPPMQDMSFDGRQSPSASSQYSVVSAPPQSQSGLYFANSGGSIEPVQQRQQPPVPRRVSYNGFTQYSPPTSYYGGASAQGSPQVNGLYYQRNLPQSFPPSSFPVTLTPAHQNANPWQHHHYISPSSAAAFPQSQDRYICQTCNKAFSRPSSLRIHSHSHTGEKPFRCPHGGCGKAFSVRSNMKRHERGCHSFDS